jgi:two-component system chemotaxis response regulator CheB
MAARKGGHNLIVIGGSAGSLEALKELVARLPGDLPAAILIVVHIPNDFPSYLPQIFSKAGPLRAIDATKKLKIDPGAIYIARRIATCW